jgi:hypothetical protein
MKRDYLKCLGFSWVPSLTSQKQTMDNNTQLPAELKEKIENEALEYGKHIPDCLPHIAYRRGATEYATKWFHTFEENGRLATRIADYVEKEKEYATKLYEAQQEIESLTNQLKNHGKVSDENMELLRQENERLQQWKSEASELVNPIFSYGQSKEANIPLGESITVVVLDRCNKFNQAKQLLIEVLVMNEMWGDLPGEFINKVKPFLDGTK